MKRGTALKWVSLMRNADSLNIKLDYSCLGYVIPLGNVIYPFTDTVNYHDSVFKKFIIKETYMCPYGLLLDFLIKGNWDNSNIYHSWSDSEVINIIEPLVFSYKGNSTSFPDEMKKSCKIKNNELSDKLETLNNKSINEFMSDNFDSWRSLSDWIEENYEII